MPDLAVAGDWVPFWLLISTAILVVVIYKFPTTLDTIDLFFLLGITIRLVQWNGFEPNGLAEFEPAEELS